jgi:hypothetical protein
VGHFAILGNELMVCFECVGLAFVLREQVQLVLGWAFNTLVVLGHRTVLGSGLMIMGTKGVI